MDGSKDTYGRHFFSSRSCDVDCDEDCNLFCTGGDNGRRRHIKNSGLDCDESDCNDISLFTPSLTWGRRRCGPTQDNSAFGFVGADSSCSSGHCETSWDEADAIETQWNEAAADLSNPTVAFAPYPKDGQINIADEEVFRGCHYSTVGISVTDPTTGSTVTEQKPHCDWEGFTDGEYANGFGECDWGGCDEWL